MKLMTGNAATTLLKLFATVALVLCFYAAFSAVSERGHGVDVRALILVGLVPLLLLGIFQKEDVGFGQLIKRFGEMRRTGMNDLSQSFAEAGDARGGQGLGRLISFTERHPDSLVRYAGHLFASRYSKEQVAKLLNLRIQREDQQWSALASNVAFLAKMSPFFGMLATVIGMVKLLENLTDFSKISGDMALSMNGTLYGIIGFTVLYGPLLKYCSGLRNQALRRNQLVARWFLLAIGDSDTSYINEEFRSRGLLTQKPRATVRSSYVTTGEQAR